MPSSEKRDLAELQVYKMLERLGIELGAGVIPRYGLMDISAVGNCRSCGAAVAALTERASPVDRDQGSGAIRPPIFSRRIE